MQIGKNTLNRNFNIYKTCFLISMYILTLILKVINKVENNFTKQNVSHLPNTGVNSKINYQKTNDVRTMYLWKKL